MRLLLKSPFYTVVPAVEADSISHDVGGLRLSGTVVISALL